MIASPSLRSVAMLKSSEAGSPSAGNWFWAGAGVAASAAASATQPATALHRVLVRARCGVDRETRTAGVTGVANSKGQRQRGRLHRDDYDAAQTFRGCFS